ncbi:MAG TPA: hypothetical protein VF859_03800 [Burkholderiales bacterium]
MNGAVTAAGGNRAAERARGGEPWADRMVSGAGFRLQQWLRRRLPDPAPLATEAARHAERLAGVDPGSVLPELRYRLRQRGLNPALVAECFGWLAAAGSPMPATVLGAAAALAAGRIVELADDRSRRLALGAAAGALAALGEPVHVICLGEARVQRVAESIRGILEPAGFGVGVVTPGLDDRTRREHYARAVVCGSYRDLATDYLRDRLRFGWRPGRAIDLIAGDGPGGDPLLPPGTCCALVDEADAVMIDEARVPIAVFAAASQSPQRLLFEQALELARALADGRDYELSADDLRLTPAGAERVQRLTLPLGGAWSLRQQREELICEALRALHLMERDVDYRVERGRVSFPEEQRPGAEPAAADEVLRNLVEIKEGCRLSERREVLARLSLPRFLGRYPRLAGICEDARGIEGELWRMYRAKTVLAAPRHSPPAVTARVFACAGDRWRALAEAAGTLAAQGRPALVLARSPGELQAAAEALAGAAIPALLLQAQEPGEERVCLEALGRGEVVVAPFAVLREAGDGPAPTRAGSVLCVELPDAPRWLATACRAVGADDCRVLVSLEDEAVRAQLGPAATEILRGLAAARGEFPRWMARLTMERAQRGIERSGALLRQELMALDQYLGDLLAFSGRRD